MRRSPRVSRPTAVITALLLLTTAAACGDDDDDTAATSDTKIEESSSSSTTVSSGPKAEKKAGADGSTVAFTSPTDGAAFAGGVPLAMTAQGITIEPAGAVKEKTGHFHVIADHGCLAKGTNIPKDADHVHFGKGQTEGKIFLEPGDHSLCLQVGDGIHNALDATDTLNVKVGVKSLEEWCSTAKQAKELETAFANEAEEFGARQAAAVNEQRVLAQLLAAMDKIEDPATSDSIRAYLQYRTKVADAMKAAIDPAAATAAVTALQKERPAVDKVMAFTKEKCAFDLAM